MNKNLFIILIFFAVSLFSSDIESLKKQLEVTTGRKNIDIRIKLIDYYWNTSPKIIRSELDKAIEKAKEMKYKSGLAKLYKLYGNYYYDVNKYYEAQFYYKKAIEILKKRKSTRELWYVYNALANTYSLTGNLKQALKYYIKALEYSKKSDNLAVIQNNIAKIYITLKEHKQALKYLILADKNCDKENYKTKQIIYTNMGIVYHNLGKNNLAKEYYLKSLRLNKKLNNTADLCKNYNNLGNLYCKLKQFDKALIYYNKAIKTLKKKNMKKQMQYPFLNIANLYYEKGDLKKALEFLDKAKNISDNSLDLNIRKNLFLLYSQLFRELKQFDKAFEYYKKYTAIVDSLEKLNNKNEIENLRLKYENEKNEKEAQHYKALFYKQRLIKTYLFFGVSIFFLISIFTILYNKRVRKMNINLEKKVEVRTRELYQKNLELSKQIKENERSFEILRRYAFLVNNAHDLLILIDRNEKIELINQIFNEKYLNSKAKIIGANFEILWEKDDYENIIKKHVEIALKGKETHLQGYFSIAKNEKKFYDIAFYPFMEDKKITYIVVSARDISEYKEVQKQLAQSEKMAALGEMAAEMAHEIKNPITIIKSTSQLLKDNFKKYDEKKIKKMLDIFVETTHRINDILNSLKDFIKTENFEMKKINLVNIINDIIEFTKSECKVKNIDVKFVYESNEMITLANEDEIYKVFLNLFINSVNAIKNNKGSIFIELFKDYEKIIFKIKDNGEGIKKEYLSKIFNPFFSTNKYGMGLGLGIVYRILKQHNAKIKVDSQLNEGTVFTIIFQGEK